MSRVAAPIAPSERIALLDVIRGLALFGIFAVNLEFMSQPILVGWQEGEGALNAAARFLGIGLFQAKSYLLFSFLFGYGLGLQLGRTPDDPDGGRRYRRRMLALFGIGLVHALLLFPGDILMGYAVIGTVLYLVRNQSVDGLRILALTAAFLGGLLIASVAFAGAVAGDIADPAAAEAALRAYREGPLSALVDQRLTDVGFAQATILLAQGPFAFALMVLGLLGARGGLLSAPATHRIRLHRWRTLYLVPGLAVSLVAAGLMVFGDSARLEALGLLLQMVSAPFVSLGYLGLFAVLFDGGRLHRLAAGAAAIGRMSLTVYLGQSLVATVLFLGLGLYGRLDAAPALVLALVVWLGSIVLARWWWRSFRIGPMEWVLRSITYAQRVPARIEPDRGPGDRMD
jgi:uncharacterized protein